MSKSPRVVVCGTGYWGKNHVRVFSKLGVLSGVYDIDPALAQNMAQSYPGCQNYSNLQDVLLDPQVEALVVATPAITHFELAQKALEHGKHVLVEKPLALKMAQAKALMDLAKNQNKILMVGHLLRYHPCLRKLKSMIDAGELGNLEYVYSNRLNLGKIRQEENILWSFAPHDVSLLLWLLNDLPIQANVVGGSYLQPNIPDTTISTFLFEKGVRAHIYVSWLHPFKEQRLVVIGSKKMAVFDDTAANPEKLRLFEKKVRQIDGNFIAEKVPSVNVEYDQGLEPLTEQAQHFLNCLTHDTRPETDAEEGLRVLSVLNSCQRSLEMNGQPVQVNPYET